MTPQDITIAVTVFDRREYIEQAVASALAQTLPVRVMVVEDCGPDPSLQSLVISRFGSRITYHRNPQRRGLFGNWNACIDLCPTPWLCLLHDDDFLAPDFVGAMVELAAQIPNKGLYYGRCDGVEERIKGKSKVIVYSKPPAASGPQWRSTDLVQAALHNPVWFPAEVFRADYAKAMGGFRATSSFTGDWDMWTKLALHYGAGETSKEVGYSRYHEAEGRGTMRVVRNGKCLGLTFMQAKKNVALLRRQGIAVEFDRAAELRLAPVSMRFLLKYASGFTRRMLAYNFGLLLQSRSMHNGHRLLQTLTRWLGPGSIRTASRLYNALQKRS